LNEVFSIAQTRDGALWLATNGDGLYRLHGGSLRCYSLGSGLASNVVLKVFVDRADTVWASGFGLTKLEKGGPDRFSPVLPQLKEHIRGIAEDREGNLWLGTLADGLFRARTMGFRLIGREQGLPARIVKNVVEDAQGNLWAAVERESPTRIAADGTVTRLGAEEGYSTDIRSLGLGADGSLWIGYRKFLQIWRHGEPQNLPQFPAVRALFLDRTGAMWVGSDDAPVQRYRDGKFELIGGLPAVTADAFTEDRDGAIYVGFLRDGMAKWKNGEVTRWNEKNGLPSNNVRAIYVDRDGLVWLGTKDRGLAILVDGRWLNPQALVDVCQDTVATILEDEDGQIFLGTATGILTAPKADILAMARGGPPARFQNLGVTDGVRNSASWSTYQPVSWKAHDGTLWFATRQGLVGVDPRHVPVNKVVPPVYLGKVTVDGRVVDLQQNPALPAGTSTLAIEYTALSFVLPQQVQFRYRMEGYDARWVEAGARRTAYFTNLRPGPYRFQVVACNNDGIWNEQGATVSFSIAPYFYQTYWFQGLATLSLGGAILGAYRLRVRRLRREALALQRQNQELERRVAERTETLRASEYFYHSLVESLPQIILRKDPDGRITYANSAFGELMGRPLAQIVGRPEKEFYPPDQVAKIRADDLRVMETRQAMEYESIIDREGQAKRYLHVKKVPLHDEQHRPIGVQVLYWDMTVFRETEEKLKAAQRELIETSRLAGIAEVATGVLHNLGNALNSVNTSATLAAGRVSRLKIPSIGKVAQLLVEQRERLVEFFATDARGRHLPEYLTQLSEHLRAEQDATVQEIDALRASLERIMDIVAAQQSHARVVGAPELIDPAELLEYALRLSEASLVRHGIDVVRELMPAPAVLVERQKALQVLVNLIRNAKESIDESSRSDKRLVLGVRVMPTQRVQLYVTDNGVGIAPENLTRIFAFGFTTKETGHGFGLHMSALTAQEMGGSLTAHSEGPGLGATFVFELPITDSPAVNAPKATQDKQS
jgi:PAS domain S-box-containing protein